MSFSSILFFLFFFPLVLISFSIVTHPFKKIILLLFSIFFYAWGAPQFLFIMFILSVVQFFIAKKIETQTNTYRKKILLLVSITLSCALLIYFKYTAFLFQNFGIIFDFKVDRNTLVDQLILPIGISFYTFESISYAIDVFRNDESGFKKIQDYLFYIFFFPKLICGPIIRFKDIASQIRNNKGTTIDNINRGLTRFILGLSKKVIIADTLGKYVQEFELLPSESLSSASAWLFLLAYTFQIYFDFSGYSDMAIGLSKTLGFTIYENFNKPYQSQSVNEFWKKWHISLGKWMKDYLYIPLGGNRLSNDKRTYLNLFIVFFISGLWHGASWNFILWGIYHAIWIILERLILRSQWWTRINWINIIITFILVTFGWIFFIFPDLNHIIAFIKLLFSFIPEADITIINRELITFLLIASFLTFFTHWKILINRNAATFQIIKVTLLCLLMCLNIAYITSQDFHPFIYFRF